MERIGASGIRDVLGESEIMKNLEELFVVLGELPTCFEPACTLVKVWKVEVTSN